MLIPEFTQADIDRKTNEFIKKKLKDTFEALSYVGIQCVNFAKKNGSYTDRTGNLRSSVGYAVISDGQVKNESHEGTTEGTAQSGALIQELAREYDRGMVLVVVAGMEYAAAVESKGYDVITNSSYKGDELLKYMKQKLGALL